MPQDQRLRNIFFTATLTVFLVLPMPGISINNTFAPSSNHSNTASNASLNVTLASVRWEYCAGVATAPLSELYQQPTCSASNTQRALLSNNKTITHVAYALSNLSFCCKSNYTAWLPAGTNVSEKDEEARTLYDVARKSMLERFDCQHFYPFFTCDPCLYAYRTWVCAMVFPLRCVASTDPTSSAALKVCSLICLDVMRKCPTEMGFMCGLDTDGMYGVWEQTAPEFQGSGGVGGGGCNRMHFNTQDGVFPSGASHLHSSTLSCAVAIGCFVVAMLFGW